MDLLIHLLIALFRGFSRARTRRELEREGVEVDALGIDIDDGVSATEINSAIARQAAAIRARAEALVRLGEEARARADEVDRVLDEIEGGRLLRDISRDQIRPALEAGLSAFRDFVEHTASMPPGRILAHHLEAGLEDVDHELRIAALRVEVLAALAAARSDRADAHRLADADAIATVMLEPIQAFANVHDLGLPRQHPIAVPADPGREAIWFGLLPEAHPILFVPADFEADLFRFASVPHELGHLLWRDLPGLAGEVQRTLQLAPAEGLFQVRGQQIFGSLDLLYAAWLPEIWADAVSILLLGPAALRGLTHSFASPTDPDRVTVAGADTRHSAYDEHPPAHVRVHLGAHLLHVMGFDLEAAPIAKAWDLQHAEPDRLVIPLEGGAYFGLPVDTVVAHGRDLLDQLYMAQLDSLAGYRLADVPGLEMSPGLWARVQRRASDLLGDRPFNDDGRIVLAAAIEARAAQPERAEHITRGLRRAILGRDTGERRVADPSFARREQTPHRWLDEARQAIVLHEVLASRGGIARSGGWLGSRRTPRR